MSIRCWFGHDYRVFEDGTTVHPDDGDYFLYINICARCNCVRVWKDVMESSIEQPVPEELEADIEERVARLINLGYLDPRTLRKAS